MCRHGTYKLIKVNYKNLERCIDACIVDEIKYLNNKGIVTLGFCCGHGEGKYPPTVLVNENCIKDMLMMGYVYRQLIEYPDIRISGVHEFQLKTGCRTYEEVVKWHKKHENEKFFKGFKEE